MSETTTYQRCIARVITCGSMCENTYRYSTWEQCRHEKAFGADICDYHQNHMELINHFVTSDLYICYSTKRLVYKSAEKDDFVSCIPHLDDMISSNFFLKEENLYLKEFIHIDITSNTRLKIESRFFVPILEWIFDKIAAEIDRVFNLGRTRSEGLTDLILGQYKILRIAYTKPWRSFIEHIPTLSGANKLSFISLMPKYVKCMRVLITTELKFAKTLRDKLDEFINEKSFTDEQRDELIETKSVVNEMIIEGERRKMITESK